MKKKYPVSLKDKKAWHSFIENMENVQDKDENYNKKSEESNIRAKLDLHGFSLDGANVEAKKFILTAYQKRLKKILIITGKGTRSKVFKDPYRSEKMNVLKYSVPEYIKNNEDLSNIIKKISKASNIDGGEGAYYIFLKTKDL